MEGERSSLFLRCLRFEAGWGEEGERERSNREKRKEVMRQREGLVEVRRGIKVLPMKGRTSFTLSSDGGQREVGDGVPLHQGPHQLTSDTVERDPTASPEPQPRWAVEPHCSSSRRGGSRGNVGIEAAVERCAAGGSSSSPLLALLKQQQDRITTLQAALDEATSCVEKFTSPLVGHERAVVQCHARGGASCPASTAAALESHVKTVEAQIDWVAYRRRLERYTTGINAGGGLEAPSIVEASGSLASPVSINCPPQTSSVGKTSSGVSSASPSPTSISVSPVIMVDISSMFSTRPLVCRPAEQTGRGAASCFSPPRQEKEVQTEEGSDPDTSPVDTSALLTMEQLRSENEAIAEQLDKADLLIEELRKHRSCPRCRGPKGASALFLSSEGCTQAHSDVAETSAKDAELRRLRLLLRFSELKKDSDRLAQTEEKLSRIAEEMRALQHRNCNLLSQRETQDQCLRSIASCAETAILSSSSGASTTELMSVLRYIQCLCSDLLSDYHAVNNKEVTSSKGSPLFRHRLNTQISQCRKTRVGAEVGQAADRSVLPLPSVDIAAIPTKSPMRSSSSGYRRRSASASLSFRIRGRRGNA